MIYQILISQQRLRISMWITIILPKKIELKKGCTYKLGYILSGEKVD